MSSSPRRHWWGAWLEVFQVGGLQEAALGVGKSQEEACLVEEAQTPVMIPQGWEQGGGCICKQLMWAISLGEWVLGCQKSFSCGAMALTLGVLLEGIRHGDGAVTEVLPIHGLNCCIRGIK